MLKYLHTMIRVTDLEKSIRFYTLGLGFTVMRREDHEKGRFTLVFLRTDGDDKVDGGPAIELTHNWDVKSYVRGDAFGHVAYEVKSIDFVQKRLREKGYDRSWGPDESPSGRSIIAFVDDPGGYEIELLEL